MDGSTRWHIEPLPPRAKHDFDEQRWLIVVAILVCTVVVGWWIVRYSSFDLGTTSWWESGYVRLGLLGLMLVLVLAGSRWLDRRVMRRMQLCTLLSLLIHIVLIAYLAAHYLAARAPALTRPHPSISKIFDYGVPINVRGERPPEIFEQPTEVVLADPRVTLEPQQRRKAEAPSFDHQQLDASSPHPRPPQPAELLRDVPPLERYGEEPNNLAMRPRQDRSLPVQARPSQPLKAQVSRPQAEREKLSDPQVSRRTSPRAPSRPAAPEAAASPPLRPTATSDGTIALVAEAMRPELESLQAHQSAPTPRRPTLTPQIQLSRQAPGEANPARRPQPLRELIPQPAPHRPRANLSSMRSNPELFDNLAQAGAFPLARSPIAREITEDSDLRGTSSQNLSPVGDSSLARPTTRSSLAPEIQVRLNLGLSELATSRQAGPPPSPRMATTELVQAPPIDLQRISGEARASSRAEAIWENETAWESKSVTAERRSQLSPLGLNLERNENWAMKAKDSAGPKVTVAADGEAFDHSFLRHQEGDSGRLRNVRLGEESPTLAPSSASLASTESGYDSDTLAKDFEPMPSMGAANAPGQSRRTTHIVAMPGQERERHWDHWLTEGGRTTNQAPGLLSYEPANNDLVGALWPSGFPAGLPQNSEGTGVGEALMEVDDLRTQLAGSSRPPGRHNLEGNLPGLTRLIGPSPDDFPGLSRNGRTATSESRENIEAGMREPSEELVGPNLFTSRRTPTLLGNEPSQWGDLPPSGRIPGVLSPSHYALAGSPKGDPLVAPTQPALVRRAGTLPGGLPSLPGPSGPQIKRGFVRPSPNERLRVAEKFGGSQETESAVEKGLEFLARYQFPDGRWRLDAVPDDQTPYPELARFQYRSDTAATGLAILAFLGAGYTHLDGQYARTVAKGLNWLLQRQKADGSIFDEETEPLRGPRMYAHGIAAIAMCEAYGMSSDESLREPAREAIRFIVSAQDPQFGGWRYTRHPDHPTWVKESDTSVSGWQLLALKSAELAGLSVSPHVFSQVERWLNVAAIDKGSKYCYNPFVKPSPESPFPNRANLAMSAEGLLMRLLLGWSRHTPQVVEGVAYLAGSPPEINPRNPEARDAYFWYYATQVLFHIGGEPWENWNKQMQGALLPAQEKSGPFAGSWDPVRPVPDRWAHAGGRIYVTALHLLILEVYYRHLPLFGEIAPPEAKTN